MTHVLKWDTVIILPLILLGSAWHYFYTWSRGYPPLALVAPVNESVWEHLKLVWFPMLLVSLPLLRSHEPRAYLVSRFGGAIVGMLIVVLCFYGYTALTQKNVLWLDIVIYCLACIAGQVTARRLLEQGTRHADALIVLGVAITSAFLVFTFYPPRIFLFECPVTEKYGAAG
ncbi:MAG: hypothetical protein IJU78_03920 [Clostridia bacterium]|nr:hypothetical protein [Clostridia bacterium]